MGSDVETIDPIHVGQKESLSYVTAIQTQAEDGRDAIFIAARGDSIPKAIDAIELFLEKFSDGAWTKSEVIIGTQRLPRSSQSRNYFRGGTVRVSHMQVTLRRK